MSPDVFGLALAGVCSVIVAIISGMKMRRSAQETEPGQGDHDLVKTVGLLCDWQEEAKATIAEQGGQIKALEAQNGSQQDQLTAQRSQIETQSSRISVLERALEVWRAWHEDIVRRWHIVRQSETPPAAPSDDLGGTLTRYQAEHEG